MRINNLKIVPSRLFIVPLLNKIRQFLTYTMSEELIDVALKSDIATAKKGKYVIGNLVQNIKCIRHQNTAHINR